MTYNDAYEAHYVENIIQLGGILIPYMITELYSQLTIFKLFVAFEIISLRGLMRHDDRCSWLIGNHHLLHHKYPNYNFGEYWIDKLCNTNYPIEGEYIYGKIYT
jgi:sterol desaturase/sphingolipid hydroxylase (fatty acid hydroxylase superfamily)